MQGWIQPDSGFHFKGGGAPSIFISLKNHLFLLITHSFFIQNGQVKHQNVGNGSEKKMGQKIFRAFLGFRGNSPKRIFFLKNFFHGNCISSFIFKDIDLKFFLVVDKRLRQTIFVFDFWISPFFELFRVAKVKIPDFWL